MLQQGRHRVTLQISAGGKPIPYGGVGEVREDGDANYGFKVLKGHPELLPTIPELQRDPALAEAVAAINDEASGLMTVGCTSGDVSDDRGFRRSGYIEFCFNSVSLISDAGSYFPLMFHYSRALEDPQFDLEVMFDWELEGVQFLEAGNVGGFTCAVIVNTGYCATKVEADEVWATALSLLGSFLKTVPPERDDTIYPCASTPPSLAQDGA